MHKENIYGLNEEELAQVLAGWQEKKFRASQIFRWLYKKQVRDFLAMSDLPQGLMEKLKEHFSLSETELVKTAVSGDGTKKLLLKLKDANLIEAVIIPAEARITGCVSTQVGCKFKCLFCASGILGWKRNLTAAEILEQILWLKKESGDEKLTHLVFMGTGEPFDNYENVIKAVRIINSSYGLNIGARRITLSTCGIIPGIKKLSAEGLQIELSVSLHAGDDKTRQKIMPVNKTYPLEDLISACREYIRKTGRQITFEYVLIKGLNSDLSNAQNLGKILKGLKLAKVNLLAANPIPGLNIVAPDKSKISLFRDYLLKQGILVTLRKSRGEDIEAGCGQLRLRGLCRALFKV